MEFLKRLSIRAKLFLVSIIPSVGLVYLLYSSIDESLERKQVTLQVYEDCETVEKLSAMLHELQQERGLFLSYLASGATQDRANISQQVTLSDAALTELKDFYAAHKKKSSIFSHLDSLGTLRNDLASYPDKLNRIKAVLLNEILSITRGAQNLEIRNQLEAHFFLLSAKEYFARTKNILLPFFIEKGFRDGQFAHFAQRKGQYDLSVERFSSYATKELLGQYHQAMSGDIIQEVHIILEAAFQDPQQVPLMPASEWWSKTTEVIKAQVASEKLSLLRIREKAEAEVTAINQNVRLNLLAGILVLLLIGVLVSFTIRHILAAIAELKRAAQKLALGEVDFAVNVTSKDELGDLAISFNKMVEVKKLYAETAEKIGKGKYDTPVLVRTNADILGLALTKMKNDLERLSADNTRRTWLLTGNGQLNDCMRGDRDTNGLANEVICQLTQFLNAQVGGLYIRENGHLTLAGRYAFDGPETLTISLGRGLVGQAAADGKRLLLSQIPDDYIKVSSALGNTTPRNIIVYPFRYEGEVKAVAEIGSMKGFSDLDLEFLDLVSDNVGIAINAAQSRAKMKVLLEETQRQSEELEAQQEELRQFNEELLEKTQLLETSEEELKAQHEQLLASNEELIEKAALLEEQKQNLEFTKGQVEAKALELQLASQYKTEFLSNMSHELRTPLNSILILAQVLMENRNRSLTEKELKFASTIYNSGNDLLNLINEILDLSKIEAGKMRLEVAPFSLGMLRQNLVSTFEELAKTRKIRFSVQCPAALNDKVIVSDQQRVSQVIKNFLSNALKFTPQGGSVDLVIHLPQEGTNFTRRHLIAQDTIGISVNDTGVGIPEEKLNIIFEAFQQVDGSTKRQYGGTGLGLSISRELAKLLGGEIHVKSEVGKGSTFTLFIPVEAPALRETDFDSTLTIHPPAASKKLPKLTEPFPIADASHYDDQHLITDGDRKILIMEDDVEFSKILLDFVHERNYKGIIAHQGNIGLSYARHYKPDAIILDMKLPGMDGTEVLRKLKSDPDLRHIPVQIISGFDERKNGLDLGAIDFIRKPVSREAFWKALDKVEHFMSRRPKKLLIIEDDQQHNEAVKELIGNGDVKCFSAYSGKEAYDILTTSSFDCIIVDLGLPDMPGLAFLEKLRGNQNLNRIPVIVYTGKDLTKEENARLEQLASTVVLKTAFSHERLLDETTLFLHRVESKLPREKQNIIRKLHKTDEILKNKRILIVDDDDRNVYSLLAALEHEGVRCRKASNGKQALEAVREDASIDLILMDVMMPEMDGFEAAKEIRKIKGYEKTPVIALTAKAMKDDREKCLAAGMSDYISKPLNIPQLLSLLRVWLYS